MAVQAVDMAVFSGDVHRTACRAQRKSYEDRSYELAFYKEVIRLANSF